MKISPIDIQQKQFKTRPFGYEKVGVDQYLEILADEMESLWRKNQDMQEELSRTKATLAEMKEREATLKETLMTTQRVTDDLKSTARKEVEVMLADAELKAERVVRNAEDRRIQLIQEIQEIKSQKVDFESSLRSLLEKHVRLLDMGVVAIEQENPDSKLLEEPLPFETRKKEPVDVVIDEPTEEPLNPPAPEAPVAVEKPSAPPAKRVDDTGLTFDFDGEQDDGGEDPLR